ncbi:MAG: UDP-N-acetylmuramoyl-tripeptide--D-alanyl-D-alanine ligase, partial [Bacilli bacterium]|nr:UDP-N-acetylmuramoyl-tripeptide--D-alanyl-D-alanine ligase [Bacilli bacterium]
MKPLSLKEITDVLGIKDFVGDNVIITNVANDIKNISENSVTFHLNKDVAINVKAFNQYKHCYLVTDQPPLKAENIKRSHVIMVNNVGSAYREFIKYYRSLFKIPAIAVTGTCGKTSTKEMISQILQKQYRVVSTFQSKNALRHYHKYLMQLDDTYQYAVFETALTHPGHIIAGCEFVKPQIGIITKIGIDHLNHCRNLNLYTKTKGEMLTALGDTGTLIINNDCENINKIDLSYFSGKIITFGIDNSSDYQAKNIKYYTRGMRFTLVCAAVEYRVHVPAFGRHNVYNALAALAAIHQLGLSPEWAIETLKDYQPIPAHTELLAGLNNSILIDDTWSSNPTSLDAALEVLSKLGKNKRKIVVIGRISYLGKRTDFYYRKVAAALAASGVDYLFTKGKSAAKIGVYAAANGISKEKIVFCNNNKELKE